MFTKRRLTLLTLLLASPAIRAQDKTDLQQILQRLDRLEQENLKLADEVHALRTELAASRGQPVEGQSTPPPPPEAPVEERVQVAEQRVADLSQEKVEASQRFPVSLTGMVLFNAFLNGKNAAGDEDPTTASATSGSSPATRAVNDAASIERPGLDLSRRIRAIARMQQPVRGV